MASDDVLGCAADLVLGAKCAGCGRPGLGPCPACRRLVTSRPPIRVQVPAPPIVFAGGVYRGVLRKLLLGAKERNALGLLPLLGGRLSASVASGLLASGSCGPITLVPVPTARAQVVERGLDLPLALARLAAGLLRSAGVPTKVWRGLRLDRPTLDQAGLGRRQRLENLDGAFRAFGRPPHPHLVVVDDIVTTGATLKEAVRACSTLGFRPVSAASVAAALRNDRSGGAREMGAP